MERQWSVGIRELKKPIGRTDEPKYRVCSYFKLLFWLICPGLKRDGVGTFSTAHPVKHESREVVKASKGHYPQPFLISILKNLPSVPSPVREARPSGCRKDRGILDWCVPFLRFILSITVHASGIQQKKRLNYSFNLPPITAYLSSYYCCFCVSVVEAVVSITLLPV